MSKVLEALVDIQGKLNVPKTNNPKDRNARYKYRSLEDINSAVKPLAAEHGCAVIYSDRFTEDGRCVSTCTLMGSDDRISADSECYVERNPKFMSKEQASGAASSYARKYAACGLFAIDSGDDPDYESDHSMSRSSARQQKPADNTLAAAKAEMWKQLQAYAERHGRTAEEILAGVKKRPEWESQHESAEWLLNVAREFEEADG